MGRSNLLLLIDARLERRVWERRLEVGSTLIVMEGDFVNIQVGDVLGERECG
jgi:hypothetical protein